MKTLQYSIAVIGLMVSLLAQEPERRPFWAPKLGGELTPTASDEPAGSCAADA